jgi:hypothetical protein
VIAIPESECVRVRPIRSEEASFRRLPRPERVKRKSATRHPRRNEWAAESTASCRCSDIEISPQTTPDLSALSSCDALATWQVREEREHVGELEGAKPFEYERSSHETSSRTSKRSPFGLHPRRRDGPPSRPPRERPNTTTTSKFDVPIGTATLVGRRRISPGRQTARESAARPAPNRTTTSGSSTTFRCSSATS